MISTAPVTAPTKPNMQATKISRSDRLSLFSIAILSQARCKPSLSHLKCEAGRGVWQKVPELRLKDVGQTAFSDASYWAKSRTTACAHINPGGSLWDGPHARKYRVDPQSIPPLP